MVLFSCVIGPLRTIGILAQSRPTFRDNKHMQGKSATIPFQFVAGKI